MATTECNGHLSNHTSSFIHQRQRLQMWNEASLVDWTGFGRHDFAYIPLSVSSKSQVKFTVTMHILYGAHEYLCFLETPHARTFVIIAVIVRQKNVMLVRFIFRNEATASVCHSVRDLHFKWLTFSQHEKNLYQIKSQCNSRTILFFSASPGWSLLASF